MKQTKKKRTRKEEQALKPDKSREAIKQKPTTWQ